MNKEHTANKSYTPSHTKKTHINNNTNYYYKETSEKMPRNMNGKKCNKKKGKVSASRADFLKDSESKEIKQEMITEAEIGDEDGVQDNVIEVEDEDGMEDGVQVNAIEVEAEEVGKEDDGVQDEVRKDDNGDCLLYTSPSPRD